MSDFGTGLRALRLSRQFSQADLGGDRFSASYISMLESGRRRPTLDVVEYLAERLNVATTELVRDQWDTLLPEPEALVRLTELQTQAREAWGANDAPAVAGYAREAVVLASELQRSDAWWEMSALLGHTLLVLEEYEECWGVADQLAAHPLAEQSALLACEAMILAATAHRAVGAGEQALSYAVAAEERSRALAPTASVRVQALIARISSEMEFGNPADAEPALAVLADLCARTDPPRNVGEAAWTLGNVAFLRGDRATGVRYHDQAATTLDPVADLRRWGRFMKAAAQVRVTAGDLSGVDAFLARATSALEIAGNRSDRYELQLTRAEYLLSQMRFDESLAVIERALETDQPDDAERAAGESLQARTFEAKGDLAAAARSAAAAAARFETAGSLRAALEQWKAFSRLHGAIDAG